MPTSGSPGHGVFTKRPEVLTNDFFVNLLDMSTKWKATSEAEATCSRDVIAQRANSSGPAPVSTSSSVRTPNSERLAEVYGCEDSQEKFLHDFVAVWDKVMNLDRFDLA
jgi:catalase-peroxidase